MVALSFIAHAHMFPVLFKPFQSSGVFFPSSLISSDFSESGSNLLLFVVVVLFCEAVNVLSHI